MAKIITFNEINAVLSGTVTGSNKLVRYDAISSIPTLQISGAHTKYQLVAKDEVSRRAVTIKVEVYNSGISGGTTLNQLRLWAGSTEVVSKTSGFSKIGKGNYAQYSFTIPANSAAGGQFGITIGDFGAKRKVTYTDATYTNVVLGTEKTIKAYPKNQNFTTWLNRNANSTIYLDIVE